MRSAETSPTRVLWKVTGSVVMMGVFGSGVAYLLYYAIIARSGVGARAATRRRIS